VKSIRLPIPPSVNAAYANLAGKGRIKTAAYRRWEKAADGQAILDGMFKPGVRPFVTGKAEIVVRLPAGMRGDVYNRGKAPEDWLVSRGFTADDKHNNAVQCRFDARLADPRYCEIDVYGADEILGVGEPWIKGGKNATKSHSDHEK